MKNFLVSLPKLWNIVAREPISSIEGLRRKFFSLGTPQERKFRYAYHSFEPASCIQRWSPGGCLTLAAAWAFS